MEISIVSIHTYLIDCFFFNIWVFIADHFINFRVTHNSKNRHAKVNDIKLCFNN